MAIAFFGIRGFSFVVLVSIFLHGISAKPVMDKIEKPKDPKH